MKNTKKYARIHHCIHQPSLKRCFPKGGEIEGAEGEELIFLDEFLNLILLRVWHTGGDCIQHRFQQKIGLLTHTDKTRERKKGAQHGTTGLAVTCVLPSSTPLSPRMTLHPETPRSLPVTPERLEKIDIDPSISLTT